MASAVPASWIQRLNAATIDGLVYLVAVIAATQIGGDGSALRALRIALVFAPLLLLEPTLISLAESTLGQRLVRLRVMPLSPTERLSFPMLVLRYWTKLVLGAVSLAYVMFSHRRQALHDRWFGTLVWYVPARAEIPAEWVEAGPDPTLPPTWRRLAAFLAWSLVGQFALGFVFGLAELAAPEQAAELAEPLLALAAIALECWLLTRAASGRLFGARRHPAKALLSESP